MDRSKILGESLPEGLESQINLFRSEIPKKSKSACFSCGTRNYVPQMSVALASVKKFNPEVDCFIIAPSIDHTLRVAAEKLGIRFIEWDFSETLAPYHNNTRQYKWPKASIWHLFCWKVLLMIGYDFSFSIDGDVLCCSSLPLHKLEGSVQEIACVANGQVGHQLHPRRDLNQEFVSNELNLSHKGCFKLTPNTGFMFWNNRELETKKFDELIIEMYRKTSSRVYVPSDQHLFALVNGCTDLKLTLLDTRWNFCRGIETNVGRYRSIERMIHADLWVNSIDEVYFMHFFKAWEMLGVEESNRFSAHTYAAENCLREGFSLWLELCANLYGNDWPRKFGVCSEKEFSKPEKLDSRPSWKDLFVKSLWRVASPFVKARSHLRQTRSELRCYLSGKLPYDRSQTMFDRLIFLLGVGHKR